MSLYKAPGQISIHALREESDQLEFWSLRTDILFQSTLSVRRATYFGSSESDVRFHFNPRSPWGERPYIDFATYLYINISIHALREESDSVILYASFNASSISIHALREESDALPCTLWPITKRDFNPRSPWGERQVIDGVTHVFIINISIHALREESDNAQKILLLFKRVFQSTLSVRRATKIYDAVAALDDISIHALREESDI